MKTVLALLMALGLAGCFTADMDCSQAGTDTFEVGGSQVGNNILSMAGSAAKTAGIMARNASGPPASNPACHAHYATLAIFGSDHLISQHAEPAPLTPTPINVTVQLAPGTTITQAAPAPQR